MSNEDRELTSALYRAFCPTSIQLGEFYMGMLPANRTGSINLHLEDCPHCRRELAELESYLDALAPSLETSLVERVKVWAAKLLPGTGKQPAMLSPALGMRGEPPGLLSYQAGEAIIHIEVQQDTHGSGRSSLYGLLTGIDVQPFQVEMTAGEQVVASTKIDELGNFVLTGLTPGRYHLSIRSEEIEILLPEFEL